MADHDDIPRDGDRRDRETRSRGVNLSRQQEEEKVLMSTYEYEVPSNLPDIPCLPGMVQRWVLLRNSRGEYDISNFTRRLREGFEVRPLDTLPTSFMFAQSKAVGEQFQGAIISCMHVLMQKPLALSKKREAYFERRRQERQQALDNPGQLRNDENISAQRKTVSRRGLLRKEDIPTD